MALPDGAFGACHVTAVTKTLITVYLLQCHAEQPPALADLAGAGPLDLDHHANPGGPYHVNIDRDLPLPPTFTWVGNRPAPAALAALSNSYTGWHALAIQAANQHRWARVLPEPAREAYRAVATRGQVDVDFGAGPVTLGAGISHLDLTDRVPAGGEVRWSALEPLGHCTRLTWAGPARGLVEAVAGRPITSGLDWRDAPETVDLTGTGLLAVSLSGSRLRSVHLPRTVQSLTLTAPDPALSVRAADGGRWLRVVVLEADEATVVPEGLHATRTLVLDGGGTLSLDATRHLTDLLELHLAWRKPPGRLTGAGGPVRHLAVLQLNDAYDLHADTLPDLPSLTHLTVDGVRRSIVPALKARFRATPARLTVRGAKADSWLAANLDNPFRDWVEQDAGGGRAACRAYAAAVRDIDRATAAGGDPEPILRTLIEALNRLDFMDTINREEAGEAFDGLVARAGVAPEQGYEWFDEWRDF